MVQIDTTTSLGTLSNDDYNELRYRMITCDQLIIFCRISVKKDNSKKIGKDQIKFSDKVGKNRKFVEES